MWSSTSSTPSEDRFWPDFYESSKFHGTVHVVVRAKQDDEGVVTGILRRLLSEASQRLQYAIGRSSGGIPLNGRATFFQRFLRGYCYQRHCLSH